MIATANYNNKMFQAEEAAIGKTMEKVGDKQNT